MTIIDARLIRQYMDIYDAILAAQPPAQHPVIEGTLTGLRFVRNQLSEDWPGTAFIEPPAPGGDGAAMTAAWRWAHLPEPELADMPARVQPWEMTRYQAYQEWLAGNAVGRVFQRAAGFLHLAGGRATAGALTGFR